MDFSLSISGGICRTTAPLTPDGAPAKTKGPSSENFLVRSFRDGFRNVRGYRSLVHLSVEQGTYAVGSTPTGARIANLIGTFLFLILSSCCQLLIL